MICYIYTVAMVIIVIIYAPGTEKGNVVISQGIDPHPPMDGARFGEQ